MREKLFQFSQRIIEYSFYLLFFLVPLILTPFNYELFEYNKMMLTYGLTIIISGIWLIKMIIGKEFRIARTPLDLPIILFLASQIISTAFSLDRHVSVWGYYSRFNGGLLSIITYILLYYAFVSNFPKEKTGKLLQAILISGAIVALYGILEHFGIDKDLWVQDVQNRVFSSLGQPNWLAAYLAVLIPTTIGLTLNSKFEYLNPKQYHNSDLENSGLFSVSDFGFLISKNIGLLAYWVIGNIFYITLLFTKSRSGFLALWISLIIFWLISLFLRFFSKIRALKSPQMQATASICGECNRLIGFFTLGFLAITFFLGAPFQQVSRFTLPELISNRQSLPATQLPTKPLGSSIIDVGITESGTIRRIVWKGAVDVFSHYPIFGSGVETFAFAYYKFRPSEHNMTSEWDFLYNKAHNEYLNYAATTGVFGIGSYLFFILLFILWSIKCIMYNVSSIKYGKNIPDFYYLVLNTGLFSAWLSILITNFFGFSVVIVQLFFFLIPAASFVLSRDITYVFFFSSQKNPNYSNSAIKQRFNILKSNNQYTINNYQLFSIIIILFVVCFLLFVICRLWYADTFFTSGNYSSRSSDYLSAYKSFKRAIELNSREPLYYDELAVPAAQLSVAFNEEKQATYSALLREEALLASGVALTICPNNINFWKTRTRMLYTLAQMDEKYLTQALTSLQQAKILAPTDPKISYNLGLLLDKVGKSKEAVEELTETTRLKPDYRDAYFALGLFFQRDKKIEKAKEVFNFILTRIATDDAETKKILEDIK